MKGLPAFGIYGHDVQDSGDQSIPDEVSETNSEVRKSRTGGIADEGKILSVHGVSLNGVLPDQLCEKIFPGISWNEK